MNKSNVNPYRVATVVHLLFCLCLLVWNYGCSVPPPTAYAAEIITPEVVEMDLEPQDFTGPSVEIPESPDPAEREPWPHELALAKTVWGEARGCAVTEQAAVVWCVLNRVDEGHGYGTIVGTICEPNQFVGYDYRNPVDPDILRLVRDVLTRWELEKTNSGEVGRVLPPDYLWFHGDGTVNHFRNAYEGGDTWDWSLPSPYGEEWLHA